MGAEWVYKAGELEDEHFNDMGLVSPFKDHTPFQWSLQQSRAMHFRKQPCYERVGVDAGLFCMGGDYGFTLDLT